MAVGESADAPADRPLRLVGHDAVPRPLLARGARAWPTTCARWPSPAEGIDRPRLDAGLQRLFAGLRTTPQRAAARAAVTRRLAVVGGGPGTGKTTTVARIAALLLEQAGRRAPRR